MANASIEEYIKKAGLRMIDEQEQKIKILREAIKAGEESGYIDNFDPGQHLANLHKKYRK